MQRTAKATLAPAPDPVESARSLRQSKVRAADPIA